MKPLRWRHDGAGKWKGLHADRHWHSYDACPDCGGRKRDVAKKCRKCRFKVGTHRVCTDCRKRLPVSAFRIRTRATPKPRSHCKRCEVGRQRKYFSKLPAERQKAVFAAKREWERTHPVEHREQLLRRRIRMLGLEAEMGRVVAAVKRTKRCSICKRRPPKKRSLHIDHDHKSKRFRGMICSSCNTGLGQFGDDPKRLRAAVKYLARDH